MKRSQRSPQEIKAEINTLLNELVAVTSGEPQRKRPDVKEEKFIGPAGGIKLLSKDGFFSSPKTQPEVAKRLQQEGYNYPSAAISVALLRAVRSRTLVRLPEKGAGPEKWAYAERK